MMIPCISGICKVVCRFVQNFIVLLTRLVEVLTLVPLEPTQHFSGTRLLLLAYRRIHYSQGCGWFVGSALRYMLGCNRPTGTYIPTLLRVLSAQSEVLERAFGGEKEFIAKRW